eukprot:3655792-Prymnesium_polylepis.1
MQPFLLVALSLGIAPGSDPVATLEADFEARKALRLAFDPDEYMKKTGVDSRGIPKTGRMAGTTFKSHVYDAHEPEW